MAKVKFAAVCRWTRSNLALAGVSVASGWLLTACTSGSAPQGFSTQVIRVINGQELEIAGVSGHPDITEQVRLAGIIVPDRTQTPWGTAAQTWLARSLTQQTVTLEIDEDPQATSRQRRVYVWRQGMLLNQALVAEGHAIVLPTTTGKYTQRLTHAQEQARLLGLGIWNPRQPLRHLPSNLHPGSKLNSQ